jgi:hypothetical protein
MYRRRVKVDIKFEPVTPEPGSGYKRILNVVKGFFMFDIWGESRLETEINLREGVG